MKQSMNKTKENNSKKKDINDVVSAEKLDKYFKITSKALDMAKKAPRRKNFESEAKDFLDMASFYVSDAHHFRKKGDFVLAFAALNYAHGWLDAGARVKFFEVYDSTLFTVDEKND